MSRRNKRQRSDGQRPSGPNQQQRQSQPTTSSRPGASTASRSPGSGQRRPGVMEQVFFDRQPQEYDWSGELDRETPETSGLIRQVNQPTQPQYIEQPRSEEYVQSFGGQPFQPEYDPLQQAYILVEQYLGEIHGNILQALQVADQSGDAYLYGMLHSMYLINEQLEAGVAAHLNEMEGVDGTQQSPR